MCSGCMGKSPPLHRHLEQHNSGPMPPSAAFLPLTFRNQPSQRSLWSSNTDDHMETGKPGQRLPLPTSLPHLPWAPPGGNSYIIAMDLAPIICLDYLCCHQHCPERTQFHSMKTLSEPWTKRDKLASITFREGTDGTGVGRV